MQVILEIEGAKDLEFIVELAERLNLRYRTIEDSDRINKAERQERIAVWQNFEGALKNHSGYEPSPSEWYEQ